VIYNASSKTFLVEHFERAHHGNIYDLAWSSGGWMFASCSEDQTIRTWTPPSRRPIIHNGHSSDIFCVTWRPQGNELFASGSSGGPIRLWDTSSMIDSQYVRTLRGHTNSTYSLVWSPDGTQLASASEDHTIRIWDPYIGQPKGILEGHTSSVTGVSFSQDGRLLASKSRDGTIRIWRTDNWQTVKIR